MLNKSKISIIGGAGHVGFPLGLIFSSKGFLVKDPLMIKRQIMFVEKEELFLN